MRILLGHTHIGSTFGETWVSAWVGRLRAAGFDVEAFSLALSPPKTVAYFDELDLLWRYKDKRLLNVYARLKDTLADFDVFVCFNGANIHPDFAASLHQTTVFGCFDDPESSDKLSRPVSHAFDIAMVGNIAELDTYRSWGVRHVHWWPLGFRADDYDPALTEERILTEDRPQDVALLCERVAEYRKVRVDKFAAAFPSGAYYGRGWPAGFLPEGERIPLLRRTRIGINIHNSTGPINFRTFYLPANGVMQICDNKSHLGKIFALGREAVGYDSIEEAIDLTRHYLAHVSESRAIAAAGWRRALTDYNELACFKRMVDAVAAFKAKEAARHPESLVAIDLKPRGGLVGVSDRFAVQLGSLRLRQKRLITRLLRT